MVAGGGAYVGIAAEGYGVVRDGVMGNSIAIVVLSNGTTDL